MTARRPEDDGTPSWPGKTRPRPMRIGNLPPLPAIGGHPTTSSRRPIFMEKSTANDRPIAPLPRRHAAAFGLLLFAAAILAGCASSSSSSPGTMGKAMQALGLKKSSQDPSAAPSGDQQLPLRLYTGANLNAGNGDQPLALVVKIYHLRSFQRFETVPFDDFLDNAKEQSALGNDLIDSREMLVLPNQRYDTVESMPGETRYLGIVALFRSPAAQRWRFTYDVKKSGASGITLGLHACALSSTAGALTTELSDPADSLASVHCPALGQ